MVLAVLLLGESVIILNPASEFTCTVEFMSPSELVEVVPPLAFQHQVT